MRIWNLLDDTGNKVDTRLRWCRDLLASTKGNAVEVGITTSTDHGQAKPPGIWIAISKEHVLSLEVLRFFWNGPVGKNGCRPTKSAGEESWIPFKTAIGDYTISHKLAEFLGSLVEGGDSMT